MVRLYFEPEIYATNEIHCNRKFCSNNQHWNLGGLIAKASRVSLPLDFIWNQRYMRPMRFIVKEYFVRKINIKNLLLWNVIGIPTVFCINQPAINLVFLGLYMDGIANLYPKYVIMNLSKSSYNAHKLATSESSHYYVFFMTWQTFH